MQGFAMNFLLFMSAVLGFLGFSIASPYPAITVSPAIPLYRRTDPYFPDYPPSCPICAQNYSSISSCAQAAPVLANFTTIIFNPGAFVDVIKCSCTDTFQSVFPQCADCFQQTNQSDVLQASNLSSVVNGMRNVCALESTLLGGVATADGEVTSSSTAATPTSTTSGDFSAMSVNVYVLYMALSILGVSLML